MTNRALESDHQSIAKINLSINETIRMLIHAKSN